MSERAREFHQFYGDLRIKDQRAFYRDRVAEYRSAQRQAVVLRNVLLLGAAVAAAAGQVMGGTPRAALAVLAATLGALAGAVTGYAALVGFGRLQKLYRDAERNLDEAYLDWQNANAEAGLFPEVGRVEEVFRLEGGQWGQLVMEEASRGQPDMSAATARSR